jgi:hypothetical protein
MRMNLRLLAFLLASIGLTLAGCGSDSAPQTFSIPIENEYEGLLSDTQEEQIAQTIEQFNLASYRATVLLNSTLFADFERTDFAVIKGRAIAAQSAIDDLITQAALLIELEDQYILPAVESAGGEALMAKTRAGDEQPTARLMANAPTGDLFHARRLVDLYMNDDAFYRKYKLSDIARRTGVSMTRLRMMMQQVQYEIEAAGYLDIEEQYATAVRNCKTIRDTAVTAEGVLVTIATGGAGAAGTLTTLQKTVQVVEAASTVLSVAESGVNVVNAAMGTDEIPPVIDAVFKGNKVVSYLLLPKSLAAKDLSSIIALTGPVDDATDWYFNVNPSTDQVDASTEPKDPKSTARHMQKQEVLDDLLLPGDYQLPSKPLVAPNKENSGFSFVEEPTSDDDFVLDAVNMADLWDLPDAPQDNLTWNTESANPDSIMEHASSQGPDANHNPLAGDGLIFSPTLADPPSVTVSASATSGTVPLIVTFSASVNNPSGEALTYSWHYGDGGYEQSSLSNPDHTYTESGSFRVTVYVEGATLGKLMGSARVEVLGAAGDDADGDETDGDDGYELPDNFVCSGSCDPDRFRGGCLDAETTCYCSESASYPEYRTRECQSVCWELGNHYISEGCETYGDGPDCLCRAKTPQELCTGTCGQNSVNRCIFPYDDWICVCENRDGGDRIPRTCADVCLERNGVAASNAICHPDSATDQDASCTCN